MTYGIFEIHDLIGKYTGNFRKLQNICKRKFESEKLLVK
jgi:hypothetical protein